MTEYQEFMKKRNALLQKKTGAKKFPKVQVARKLNPSRLGRAMSVIFATLLAGGGVSLLVLGEDEVLKVIQRVGVSVFSAAVASEKKSVTPEKAKGATANKEEKSANTSHAPGEKPAVSEGADSNPENKEVVVKKSWTEQEVILFTKLEARKKELDLRESDLHKLDEELQNQKGELEKKLKSLEEVRQKIERRLEDMIKLDQQKVDALVLVYTNMKPANAAKLIESINEDLAVEVMSKMKNKNAAEILNIMNGEKAKRLSERFAGYRDISSSEK